ncbi:MAG: DUF4957 domain-containing protein [Paludibacteraceae bacterium]|nr:DUF4957 domain-containing protein [Paludibacteraceae bacterium]
MKKFLFFCAALLVAMTASAKIWDITPTHCHEGDRSDGYTLFVELDRGAQAGDTIRLADGEYMENQSLPVNNNVVIMAAEGAHPIVVMNGYFQIKASLIVEGIRFHCKTGGQGYCMYFYENSSKYLKMKNCEFMDFTQYCVSSWEAYHIDSCIVDNCYFHDLAKAPFYFAASSLADDVNACDNLTVTNSTFANITLADVAVLDLRNNNNNTQATSKLRVDHCTFYNCKGYERMIQAYKSPDCLVSNCIMMNPLEGAEEPAIYATYLYGGDVKNCLWFQTKRVYTKKDGGAVDNLNVDPQFVDAANGNYFLKPTSPAMGAASDGTNLGDPRWWPTVKFKGAWDGWTEHNADFAADYSKASVSINMSAGANLEFGVMINEVFRANGYEYHRGFTGAAGITDNTSNMKLQADMSGDYIFEWYFANDSMAIIFPEPTLANGYYLVGEFNGVEAWGVADLSADKMLVKNTEALGDEYMISDVALVAGDALKVVKVEWDAIKEYLPAESNYTVDADHQGTKIIYFRPNKDGGSDWFYNTIYIEANGGGSAIDNTEASMKAVKMIENGQLYIIKNGVKFNAIGEVVK